MNDENPLSCRYHLHWETHKALICLSASCLATAPETPPAIRCPDRLCGPGRFWWCQGPNAQYRHRGQPATVEVRYLSLSPPGFVTKCNHPPKIGRQSVTQRQKSPCSKKPVRTLFSFSMGIWGTRSTFGGVLLAPMFSIRLSAASSRLIVELEMFSAILLAT